jgi:hypothetical protein
LKRIQKLGFPSESASADFPRLARKCFSGRLCEHEKIDPTFTSYLILIPNPSKSPTKLDSTLDHLLIGEPDHVKAKVLEVLMQYNLSSDDPAFILMAATGRLQALLEEKPKDLNALFKQWRDEVYRQVADYREGLKEYERTALEAQKTAIAQTVHSLIRKTTIDQFMHQLSAASTIVAALLLMTAAGVGGGVGWMYAQWQRSQVESDPSGKRQLTLNEANTLKWAMSQEGQFALLISLTQFPALLYR